MYSKKTYKFNKETLNYEIVKTSLSKKMVKSSLVFILSLISFFVYFYIYTIVFEIKTPKSIILEDDYYSWMAQLDMLEKRADHLNNRLNELQIRDNLVYRPVFGMDEISSEVRNAGFGGVDIYEKYKLYDNSGILKALIKKIDILTKKTYIQSCSFDDISVMAKRSEEMSQCIPTISPIFPDKKSYISSRFGYRIDPFNKRTKFHQGVDLCSKDGTAIFVTGDGKVVRVGFDFFGYGNFVIVDHGFGYRTRYAHLKKSMVVDGQKLKRGDQVGQMGNTGRSSGTHLHYEVIYKSKRVNPLNYFNFDISEDNYFAMVRPKLEN